MTNLLEETKNAIKQSGHKPEDIIFIGSEESGHHCTWDLFCTLSDKEYYSGYGSPEVATDLIIVFSDGAKMWRGEYDGSEWWEYSTTFKMPKDLKSIKQLFGGLWSTLEELNKGGAHD
jgi:hypothetical protein